MIAYYTFSPITREEVLSLEAGDSIIHEINGRFGEPMVIAEVTEKKVSEFHGKAWAHFYRHFGPGSTMSGSIREGDTHWKIIKATKNA